MVTLLLHLLRLLPMLCGGHRQVALENLALRHQLAVYKKMVNRPKLLSSDRLFWVALSRVWAGWRQALVIVSPNTVLRWPAARASGRRPLSWMRFWRRTGFSTEDTGPHERGQRVGRRLSENHRSSRQRKLGPHVSRPVRTRRRSSAELDF